MHLFIFTPNTVAILILLVFNNSCVMRYNYKYSFNYHHSGYILNKRIVNEKNPKLSRINWFWGL